jgi:ABC-type antimicrobial peptide transport system permease subunit
VLALVLRQGLARAAVGLAAGFALAAAASGVVAGALYGVRAADPVVWACAAAVVIGVTLLANVLPARRAMRIDPVRALRTE